MTIIVSGDNQWLTDDLVDGIYKEIVNQLPPFLRAVSIRYQDVGNMGIGTIKFLYDSYTFPQKGLSTPPTVTTYTAPVREVPWGPDMFYTVSRRIGQNIAGMYATDTALQRLFTEDFITSLINALEGNFVQALQSTYIPDVCITRPSCRYPAAVSFCTMKMRYMESVGLYSAGAMEYAPFVFLPTIDELSLGAVMSGGQYMKNKGVTKSYMACSPKIVNAISNGVDAGNGDTKVLGTPMNEEDGFIDAGGVKIYSVNQLNSPTLQPYDDTWVSGMFFSLFNVVDSGAYWSLTLGSAISDEGWENLMKIVSMGGSAPFLSTYIPLIFSFRTFSNVTRKSGSNNSEFYFTAYPMERVQVQPKSQTFVVKIAKEQMSFYPDSPFPFVDGAMTLKDLQNVGNILVGTPFLMENFVSAYGQEDFDSADAAPDIIQYRSAFLHNAYFHGKKSVLGIGVNLPASAISGGVVSRIHKEKVYDGYLPVLIYSQGDVAQGWNSYYATAGIGISCVPNMMGKLLVYEPLFQPSFSEKGSPKRKKAKGKVTQEKAPEPQKNSSGWFG